MLSSIYYLAHFHANGANEGASPATGRFLLSETINTAADRMVGGCVVVKAYYFKSSSDRRRISGAIF